MAIRVVDHLNAIHQSYEGQLGPLPPVVIPTILTIDTTYSDIDEFSIYQWNERAPLNKAHCLDFGDPVQAIRSKTIWVSTLALYQCFGVTWS